MNVKNLHVLLTLDFALIVKEVLSVVVTMDLPEMESSVKVSLC